MIFLRLLLHVCCGPCGAYPVKHLLAEGHEVVGYFYNPNIHPYKEFQRRLETAQYFAEQAGIELIVDNSYILEEFLITALAAMDVRCTMCYETRLRKTAQMAKEKKLDCFSTTLLVSPYQKHNIISETAERIAAEEQIPFFYIDFRPGWQEGVAISKEMGLYRQPYCGCIFSEKERYYKKRKGGS